MCVEDGERGEGEAKRRRYKFQEKLGQGALEVEEEEGK